MKTGIIGAGRAGCSLGNYFHGNGVTLAGYYDTDSAAAKEAAEFTQTAFFTQLEPLVRESDLLLITTPDSQIVPVWEQIKGMLHRNQIIGHCSGALSSDSFSGADEAGVFCCSVHPMLPFSNKFSSSEPLEHAFFTVEGHPTAIQTIRGLLTSCGNTVCEIDAAVKPSYHAAASILSNQVIAVLDFGYQLLEACGFSREEARRASAGLVQTNLNNVLANGCTAALTGPIERGDTATVKKHLACLSEADARLYRMLGARLLVLAQQKNPTRDYGPMQQLLCMDE